MRRTLTATALACLALGADAGLPTLTLTAQSPTTIMAGGTVDFRLDFFQIQEGWSFDNGDGEPSPDIGFQRWQSAYREAWNDRLTDLDLQLLVGGRPVQQRNTQPDAAPRTDYTTSWQVTLRFDQPGLHTVTAAALVTQAKDLYRAITVGTRECVGFDNSVQCTLWDFRDEVLDDLAWTETTPAVSASLQVQAVPEPATTALWLAGLAGLALRARRRAG